MYLVNYKLIINKYDLMISISFFFWLPQIIVLKNRGCQNGVEVGGMKVGGKRSPRRQFINIYPHF